MLAAPLLAQPPLAGAPLTGTMWGPGELGDTRLPTGMALLSLQNNPAGRMKHMGKRGWTEGPLHRQPWRQAQEQRVHSGDCPPAGTQLWLSQFSCNRQRQSCNLLSPGMNTLSVPQHPSPRCCQSAAETAWSSCSTET